MQATKFLKEEHGKAKAAFQEIEAAPAPQRRALWTKLRPELELHETDGGDASLRAGRARGPGRPGVRGLGEQPTTRKCRKRKVSIREIDGLDATDSKWLATVKKLRGALEQHIRKEEQEIWPKIEQVWTRSGSRKPGGRWPR